MAPQQEDGPNRRMFLALGLTAVGITGGLTGYQLGKNNQKPNSRNYNNSSQTNNQDQPKKSYQSRDFCLAPFKPYTNSETTLTFVYPNPNWIEDGGYMVTNGFKDPNLNRRRDAIETRSIIDHLTSHSTEPTIASFEFIPNTIYEGRRSNVLKIMNNMLSSSPQIRGTSYIDLGQNGIVNRLHHYGKDEQYSRVRTFSIENLDKFEEHNRQKKVTQEYEYLLKEIEQLDEDWDMETKSKKIT